MRWPAALLGVALVSLPALALAHAFPENSSPHVGASLLASPPQVKIWFISDLESLFNELRVKDGHDEVVSVGKATGDAHNPELLSVQLRPALSPGQYHVYWRVTARDGHHTQGDFVFNVEPGK